jgi:hypothetical protein
MRKLFLIVVLLTAVAAVDSGPAAATEIPDVHFAVFRFDYMTDSLLAVYEFSQPYYKSLPPPGYRESVNLHWDFEWPSDFGFVDVTSRLTGERILRATSVWMGYGHFEYPPDSLASTTLQYGYSNPPPDSLISPGIIYPTDVSYAWGLVYDTDVISRLSSHGTYEAYAWVHNYADGGYGPLYELFIVAATVPVGPDDMAILDVQWPRTLVTSGVEVTPEVLIHNFGDAPVNLTVSSVMTGAPDQPYSSVRNPGLMPADETRVVLMHPVTVFGTGDLTFDFGFQKADHSPWSDTYPQNDSVQQLIQVTDFPVFRYLPLVPSFGSVRAVPVDFDGDGDIDICELAYYTKLWQNDGIGGFTDVTSGSQTGYRTHPEYVVCEDFNGDTYPDIFISFANESPQLLEGDGTGVFTDITGTTGLGTVNSYGRVLPIDLENDGDIDVILLSQGQEIVIENDGAAYFTDVTAASGIIDNGSTYSIAGGDLNNDELVDVVLLHAQRDAEVYISDGDGTFTLLSRSWGITNGHDAAVFDYDNDGDQDLLFSHWSPRFYRNDVALVFEDITSQLGGVLGAGKVDVADFNEDGWLDVVFADGTLLVNGGGLFTDNSGLLVGQGAENPELGYDVHFLDIFNTGDVDVCGENATYFNQGVRTISVGAGTGVTVPQTGHLDQNYPNPFNPATTIRYRIPEPGRVTLVIYNVAGQRVKTLVDEFQNPLATGRVVRWDGRNEGGERVASGIYFYQLTAPAIREIKKLLLLK